MTPKPFPQHLIESWKQAQSDLDNRSTDDLHSTRHKVQLCKTKPKNHPHDGGSQAELNIQLKDFEEKERGKVASIQAHVRQISSRMEMTFHDTCVEEVRAVGMERESPEDGARRLLEEWRSVAVRLWEVRDDMAVFLDEATKSRRCEAG